MLPSLLFYARLVSWRNNGNKNKITKISLCPLAVRLRGPSCCHKCSSENVYKMSKTNWKRLLSTVDALHLNRCKSSKRKQKLKTVIERVIQWKITNVSGKIWLWHFSTLSNQFFSFKFYNEPIPILTLVWRTLSVEKCKKVCSNQWTHDCSRQWCSTSITEHWTDICLDLCVY